MIGYSPAELAIRATLGKPPDTGTDDEATWHDHPAEQPETRPAA